MTVTRITDFTPWDLREEFSDWEAAYLWFGFEPNYSAATEEHPSNVIALRAALAEAVERGELQSRSENRSGRYAFEDQWGRARGVYAVYPTVVRYSRQALKRWAERKGQRPLFLFLEDRQAPAPAAEIANVVRREQGKRAAIKRHADKNRWYRTAEQVAADRWEKGSTLRHDQMATELLKEAPAGTSRKTLLNHLASALHEMGRDDLIRGSGKKHPPI